LGGSGVRTKKGPAFKPASKSAIVRDMLKGRNMGKSLLINRVAELAGLTINEVSDPLTRMSCIGQIARTENKPYRYFDVKFKKPAPVKEMTIHQEKDGQMPCAMRSNREIKKEVCVPNPEADACNFCLWGCGEKAA
jgi:hypothetical protein